MAASDAVPVPRKNTAYRVTFPILDADGDLVTGAGSLDSEVSKDAAAFADCTNEATEIATNSGMYYLDLTSDEMNADTVAVIVKSSSGKTTPIVLYPEELGDIRVNVGQISGDATAADNLETMLDGTGGQTLSLGALTVSGATTLTGNVALAAGLTVTQSTTDTPGIDVTGNGSAAGMRITGGTGAAGHGLFLRGSTSGGDGLRCLAQASPFSGIQCLGNGSGPGIRSDGGATGNGITIVGGATSGIGLRISTTSGDGIDIAPTAGHGIDINANGTSKHGINATGGTAGTSDGLKLTAGTGGVGFRLDTLTSSGTATLDALTVTNALTAGSNAVPWNAAWDAEVQSEVEDALVVHRLDELLNADSDIDGAAPPTVGSVFHELLTKTTGSFTFDQTTDSLEALRDRGDAAWITATGFSTHSAADVWAVGTRTLTAGTNINGSTFTAIPWNAAWDAEVQSEVDDALVAQKLDHLVAVADADDAVDNSIIAKLASKGATADWSSFVNTTDSLEALRDRGDAAWTTATGFSTHSAADVWSVATRVLTANTNLGFPTNFSSLSISAGGLVKIQSGLTKNTALANFEFLMVDSSDHITPKTGLTVTATRSIDGGAFASCTNSVSEVASGIYKINLSASDMNGDIITFRFAASGADDRDVTIATTP